MSEFLAWSHYNPVRIKRGPLNSLAKHIKGQHVLLVTSRGFVRRGVVQYLKDILAPRVVTVWDGVLPNPDWRDIEAITKQLRGGNVDCVVGLGGGSALDAAKILASIIANPSNQTLNEILEDPTSFCWDYKLPLIAIPTTSGTGAEVTPFATVWDHEKYKKYSLAGDFIYPDIAFLDASLTLTLGEVDTLYPALDAISHALESLWNKNSTPISRTFATQSLAYSNQALPLLIKAPDNLEYRATLQDASLFAGLAISQTKTAIAHSISYPLTTKYGVPHGLACSFTLPQLLEWNISLLVADGIDDVLLGNVLNMLKSFNLNDRISEYVTVDQMFDLETEMVTKGRAENFLYLQPKSLRGLLDLSMGNHESSKNN